MSEIKIPWDDYCKMDMINKYPDYYVQICSLYNNYIKLLKDKSNGRTNYFPTNEGFNEYFERHVTLRGKGN